MHDPLDIQGQESEREEARQQIRLYEKIEGEDTKRQMSNKQGRRFVYRLLESAGVWRLSFSTNAMQMAFNEGGRNQGLMLLMKLMAHCPEQYAVMLQEHEKNG